MDRQLLNDVAVLYEIFSDLAESNLKKSKEFEDSDEMMEMFYLGRSKAYHRAMGAVNRVIDRYAKEEE